ncbi:very short patch repair endonuclease [Streptomyces sp. NPDC056982]|uniref:very short patch repair endonuclease n=1 Tax=Streptomyces sp. NPDC056982 TaxID=3345986 RepID=UPI003645257F
MPRDPAVTSRIMAAVKSKNTRPEMTLRKALWNRGLRYRLHASLPGRPDIVFPSARLVVFVDGDFWHGNAWRVRGMRSFDDQFRNINNGEKWRAKIVANVQRDEEVTVKLKESGWCVYRVFESRLKSDLGTVVDEIECRVRNAARAKNLRKGGETGASSRAET